MDIKRKQSQYWECKINICIETGHIGNIEEIEIEKKESCGQVMQNYKQNDKDLPLSGSRDTHTFLHGIFETQKIFKTQGTK